MILTRAWHKAHSTAIYDHINSGVVEICNWPLVHFPDADAGFYATSRIGKEINVSTMRSALIVVRSD